MSLERSIFSQDADVRCHAKCEGNLVDGEIDDIMNGTVYCFCS